MTNSQQVTGIFPAKCKHCEKRKYQKSFLKKYWCSLNNKLCGYVEVYDCKFEVKENDK